MLLSNINPVGLKYIKRPENPEDFDPLFTESVVLLLASKIAFRITQDKNLEMSMLQQYLLQTEKAQMMDGESAQEVENEVELWADIS